LEALREKGASICYSDPFVPMLTIKSQTLKSQVLSTELLQSMDCVAVLTDHSVLDYALIAASAPLIFDTRNALTDFPKANVVRL
jgi:UDP-N-acetyl-D-glucosamine dehydrogenase